MSPLFRRSSSASHDEGARIAQFWAWWAGARSGIAAAIDAREPGPITDEVARAVAALAPGLAWEIGPGLTAGHQLCFSGEGDMEKRALTARIVAGGPGDDDTWEYHPARQPVPGGATSMLKVGTAEIPFADLRVGVTVDSNRERLDLSVWHPAFASLDQRARMQVSFLALDGLLGEDDVERWVGRIDAVTDAPSDGVDLEGVLAARDHLAASATGDHFALLQASGRDGKPRIIALNTALKQIDHLDKSQRLTVTVQLRSPNPNGFPVGEEADTLDALEERLLAAVPASVYAGRVAGAGRRVWTWFVADGAAATAAVEAVVRSAGWKATVAHTPDPRWGALKEGLLVD